MSKFSFSQTEFLSNYSNFAIENNFVVAKTLLEELKRLTSGNKFPKIQKLLYLRIFFELILATEMLQIVLWAVRSRCEKPFLANLLDDGNDANAESAKCEHQKIVEEYKGKLFEYLTKYLGFSLPVEDYKKGKKALDGIVLGIETALQNRTAKSKHGEERILVKAFNKLKHGFPVINYSDFPNQPVNRVGIFTGIREHQLKDLTVDLKAANRWVGTIEATMNTIKNLLNLVLQEYQLEATRAK